MLDIEEFHEKKKKLFKSKDRKHTLLELRDYVSDLEIVSANEQSSELADLIKKTIDVAKLEENELLLFRLYIMYFHQIYPLARNLEESKKLIRKMDKIASKSSNPELEAYVFIHKSVLLQLEDKNEESLSLANNAIKLIEPYEEKYSDVYYRILYTYSYFMWLNDNTFPEAENNFEKCIYYWYNTYHTLPMITAIFALLRVYNFSGNTEKFNDLLDWIFNKKSIQNRLIDSHFSLLFSFVGRVLTVRLELDAAIEYLAEAYKSIENSNSQQKMMYYYIESLVMLSRCYAYKGEFQKSYEFLIELFNFVESDYVKLNYQAWRLRRLYFSIYYTLLFIFAQLDMKISEIKDNKLKRIYDYVKVLLEKSRLPEELLVDTSLDEKEFEQLIKEKDEKSDELYLSLQQQLLSLETYDLTEQTIEKVSLVRDHVYNPLYADIVIGRIHLAIGNFEEFNKIVLKIKNQKKNADTPILELWIKLFELLSKYIENPSDRNLITNFEELENYCKSNNFIIMAEEVNLYQKFILSSKTIDVFVNKFQQTAFMDIYTSKRISITGITNDSVIG